MKSPKCANRCTVAHYRPDHSVSAVFLLAESIAVFHNRVPAGEAASPRADVVINAYVVAQDVTAPAIVIARNPEDRQSGIFQVRQRGEGAKAVPGNYRFPFKPEIEKVPVNQQRPGSAFEIAEKPDQRTLGVERRDAEMRIGNDIAGRSEHTPIVAGRRGLYKLRPDS